MMIGERIKKVRQEKHLTQQSFAERMNLKQNTITRIETGVTTPSPAITTLICREFNVNETWLRTGEGEMFARPSGKAEQVAEWVQSIFTHGSDTEKSFVTAMSTFTKEDWSTLERLIRKVWEEQQALSPAKTNPPALTIDEKVALYRAELEAEEKAKEKSSALHGTGEESA